MTKDMPVDVLAYTRPFRSRTDMIPHDGFRPQWLSAFHTSTGEDPVLVFRVRRFFSPSQEIRNDVLAERHCLLALFCFHGADMLVPDRLADVERTFIEVDITPLCSEQLASPHSSGNVEENVTCPSFCTRFNERVYITAIGCEICFGTTGLQAAGAGGL